MFWREEKQELFENIIEKLEESQERYDDVAFMEMSNNGHTLDFEYANGKKDAMNEAIEIVKQAAAEYNNTIIDGKYCFQTCACTEKCDKCIRLCNGDIDWYENIDNWAEEYNNGWIPCSEPPKDDRYVLLSFDNFSVPMVGRYEEDEKGGSYYIGDEMEPCVTQDIFVNAWQPLPESYQQKGE